MGGLKTLLLVLLALPNPVRAREDTLVTAFATCAGRFSAELEHAWLMYDERASEFEHRRKQFIDLLNATVPSDRRRHALSLRIDAKLAHAQLLTQATFSGDADRSAWAVRRAKSEIANCTGYLLES